eukprot:scaffold58698_cov70-Phaeocystis_antarctica.AAC.8
MTLLLLAKLRPFGTHERREAPGFGLMRDVGLGIEQRLAVTPKYGRLTLAPRCSSSRTTASCAPAVAATSSVPPSGKPCARPRESTSPPSSSHATTACALPSLAACSTAPGSPSPIAALANEATAVGSAATVEGAALTFFFLPLPFLAATLSASTSTSAGSPSATASAADGACSAEAATLVSALAVSCLVCCRSSCAIVV